MWSAEINIVLDRWWKSRGARLLGTWFYPCSYSLPLFEEIYTATYQHCIWQNGPHWAGCWKNLLQEIIAELQPLWSLLWKGKQGGKRESKEMDWVACWQPLLWSKFFIFDFDVFSRREAKGKEKPKGRELLKGMEVSEMGLGGEVRARWRKKWGRADSVAGQCRTERAGESYQAFKPLAGQEVPDLWCRKPAKIAGLGWSQTHVQAKQLLGQYIPCGSVCSLCQSW